MKWVKLEDKKPFDGERCLAINDTCWEPLYCIYTKGQFQRMVDVVPGERVFVVYYPDINHWMPLPKFPKEMRYKF